MATHFRQRLARRRLAYQLLALALVLMVTVVAFGQEAVAESPREESATQTRHFAMMIVYASTALLFSFLCSIAEAVVLSVSPSYIANMKSTGRRSAFALESIKANIDRSLAAILTLNTIAHTVGAGGAGAEAAAYFGERYVGLAMAVLTLLILFLSEIIPKTLGALYWRRLAPSTARFVQVLQWVLYPLLVVSEAMTKLLTRGRSLHTVSRDELAAMADVGHAAGQLDVMESRILKNVFRLPGLRAEDVMTPRTVVFTLQQDLTVADVLVTYPDIAFSRIPVYASNRDEITGFVLKYDILLNQHTNDGKARLRDLKRDIRSVPSSMRLSQVLEELLADRAHVLLVVDEYGGTDGLITLEDLVETLIGIEIVDEADEVDDMRRLARQKWQERMKRMGIDPQDFDAAARDKPTE